MNPEPALVVATVTLARDDAEARLIVAALSTLSRGGWPIVAVDGGSPSEFLDALRAIHGVDVHTLPDGERGLVAQVRHSLKLARGLGTRRVLYTEPDKADFFAQHLDAFLRAAAPRDDAIVIASRSEAAMATFPESQQRLERMASALCGEHVGFDADFFYGPFLFAPSLIDAVLDVPAELGWGWRPFLFAFARLGGARFSAVTGDYDCPAHQREDNDAQRVLRLTQCSQNVAGLAVALRRRIRSSHQ